MPAKPREKEKEDPLAAVLAGIDRDFGKGTIMRLGDSDRETPKAFSSGSIALDEALGIGGFPYGRIIEIYGPESSGKTSLALHATGNVQRAGRRAAFIDAEHAFDPEWAATLGVDTDNLYVSQPDSGEQALKVADRLVRSSQFSLITVDSVAALVPEAELRGEIGDSHVGLQARMMSQGLRMITGPCSATGTALIFINQLREKVGVMFGSPETTTGGKALKFYASVRLDVRRIETLKSGPTPVGSKVRVKVVKNKVARPFRQAEFDFIFGEGISQTGELVDLGVERGVIAKAGAVYRFPGQEKAVQGREKARAWLAEHPDECASVDKAVRAAPPVLPSAARGVNRGRTEGISMEGSAPWDESAGTESSDT